jgi:high-affinity nickel permease
LVLLLSIFVVYRIVDGKIGFDTASSIALLAISALAKKDANGNSIAAANIVILPVRKFLGSFI